MQTVTVQDWRSRLAPGSIETPYKERFLQEVRAEMKHFGIQEAVEIHGDAIDALQGRGYINTDIEWQRKRLAYDRKIPQKWQEITWEGKTADYAKRIHLHVGGTDTVLRQELTDDARARREESKAIIDQIRREDIFKALYAEKAGIIQKIKTMDPAPWAKAMVKSGGAIRLDWETREILASLVSILAEKDLKAMKKREITTALIFNGFSPSWYQVLRYELDMQAAKRSAERRSLIEQRDQEGRSGAHRDDRQTRNFRKVLAKVNTTIADDPDVKMANAGRTVLLTLTTNRDMHTCYLKLADKVLEYIRSRYGDGWWSANRWECPWSTRHLHMTTIIPGIGDISDGEKEDIKDDVYRFWARLVRNYTTKSGHAVWAVKAAQDIQMVQGLDDIKAIFGYVSKRTERARASDAEKVDAARELVDKIVSADKTAIRMKKEGNHQAAAEYEAAFSDSVTKQQLEDLSFYAPIMHGDDLQEANDFFHKIGRSDLMVDPIDAQEVKRIRTRAPFERCWSISNRKEYKKYIKTVTIELPDDETYYQVRAELCMASNRISESVKSSNRAKPKMFSCDMEFLLLTAEQVQECINIAVAKVEARRQMPRPRCWRGFNKRSIQLPPQDIRYPLRA